MPPPPEVGIISQPEEGELGGEEKKEDDGHEDAFLIFFDPKTGTMGKLNRSKLFDTGILCVGRNENDGTEFIQEAVGDAQAHLLFQTVRLGMKKKKGKM